MHGRGEVIFGRGSGQVMEGAVEIGGIVRGEQPPLEAPEVLALYIKGATRDMDIDHAVVCGAPPDGVDAECKDGSQWVGKDVIAE